MGESADELERQIGEARARLAHDIDRLESQVRTSTDWRVQFGRHAWAVLACAFAVGMLLGMSGRPRETVPCRSLPLDRI